MGLTRDGEEALLWLYRSAKQLAQAVEAPLAVEAVEPALADAAEPPPTLLPPPGPADAAANAARDDAGPGAGANPTAGVAMGRPAGASGNAAAEAARQAEAGAEQAGGEGHQGRQLPLLMSHQGCIEVLAQVRGLSSAC